MARIFGHDVAVLEVDRRNDPGWVWVLTVNGSARSGYPVHGARWHRLTEDEAREAGV